LGPFAEETIAGVDVVPEAETGLTSSLELDRGLLILQACLAFEREEAAQSTATPRALSKFYRRSGLGHGREF
jgi:hypothetical protein